MCPSQSRTRCCCCCCCLCCRACFAAIFCYLYWIFSSPSSRADEHLSWPSLSLSSPPLPSALSICRVRCFSGVCHQMSLTRFALCCISSTNINTRQKAATTATTTRVAAASCISIIYLAISMPTLNTPFTLCWATSAFSFLTVWLSVCSFFQHFHVFPRFRDSRAERRWKGGGGKGGYLQRDCYQCWLNGRHTQGTHTLTHTQRYVEREGGGANLLKSCRENNWNKIWIRG